MLLYVKDNGEDRRTAIRERGAVVTPIPSFPLNGEAEWKVLMKRKTTKSLEGRRRILAHLDGLWVKVNVLRELQSASGEELSTLMPSVLHRAFKGEL